MTVLTLYSTSGCGLCERLLDILLSLPEAAGYQLQVVDVAYDEGLLASYGELIPVLGFGSGASFQRYTGPLESEPLGEWLSRGIG
ncbi:MAG: glutaredoxin family protein [Pseudomonadota bacterium]